MSLFCQKVLLLVWFLFDANLNFLQPLFLHRHAVHLYIEAV